VQNLLGILPQVHEARSQADKVTANALLVKLELQADCLAGVWAYHADKARNVVEAGDVEEAYAQPQASAMIACKCRRKGMSCPMPSRMPHLNSGHGGSHRASRAAIQICVIPSRRKICNLFTVARIKF
jgi:hypothetical protein